MPTDKTMIFNEIEYKDFYDEIHYSKSDRACVIVSAAAIDDSLKALLSTFMVKYKLDELFSGNGPLSTFSSKIKMSYNLGLISKQEHDLIEIIRRIRNDYAHKKDYFSLDERRDQITHLSIERKLYANLVTKRPKKIIIPKIDSSSPREVFEIAVITLCHMLNARRISIIGKRRQIPDNYTSSLDYAKTYCDYMSYKYRQIKAREYDSEEYKTGAIRTLNTIRNYLRKDYRDTKRALEEECLL